MKILFLLLLSCAAASSAVRFNDSVDRLIRTASVVNYNAAYTVMFHVQIAVDRNDWTDFFSINDGTSSAYDVIGTDGGGDNLQVEISVGGSSGGTYSGGSLGTGWNHIAVVRASTTSVLVYLNGTLVNTISTGNTGSRASATRMEFNGTSAEGEFCNCRIAAVKIWSAALNGTEVLAERDQYDPARTANLIYNSPLIDDHDDDSGNSGAWTSAGTLEFETGPSITLPGGGGGGGAETKRIIIIGELWRRDPWCA